MRHADRLNETVRTWLCLVGHHTGPHCLVGSHLAALAHLVDQLVSAWRTRLARHLHLQLRRDAPDHLREEDCCQTERDDKILEAAISYP